MPTTYVLNSPVLSHYGTWHFKGPVTLEDARDLLRPGFVSAVGHESTARLLSRLLGIRVERSRHAVEMGVGDRALVFRLGIRIAEGQALEEGELRELPFELGVLERVE